MESRIRAVATDLFIRDGYNGVSFLLIGKALGITHSNIHYYFKTKADLATAALSHYAAETLAAYEAIWTDRDTNLVGKVVASRDWAHGRYRYHNPSGEGAAHWGLLDRFGHDAASLTADMRATLRTTAHRLEHLIGEGVRTAVERGELRPRTPVDDVILQLANALYSSRQATRFDGSFERLDRLLHATVVTIRLAYGARSGPAAAWPQLPIPRRRR